MTHEQKALVAALERKGQGGTAGRVARLCPTRFESFKRDLLVRYAADGRFE